MAVKPLKQPHAIVLFQFLDGAGHGGLAGTAAAAHETDDLAFPEVFETAFALGRRHEIRRTGAHVLGLLTPDDAYFLHNEPLC